MPFYTYECTECHDVFDDFKTISKRDTTYCNCGNTAKRNLAAELATSSDCTRLMKDNQRWSWSMGVHLKQIPDMVKAYPGSEYHPETGQLLIRNRQHKLHEMKRRGYEETG